MENRQDLPAARVMNRQLSWSMTELAKRSEGSPVPAKLAAPPGEVINGHVGDGTVGQGKDDGEGVTLHHGEIASVDHKGHAVSPAHRRKKRERQGRPMRRQRYAVFSRGSPRALKRAASQPDSRDCKHRSQAVADSKGRRNAAQSGG